MKETIIDDCYYERSESIPVCKTSGLHIVERPSELGCAGDQEVEEKCGHFSIRGYVAEVRKRDWKISWPFSVPDGCNKLDEDTHWLPPLRVSEFRWWRCPNCLQKIATGADTDAGVVTNCFCNEVKGDFTCFREKAIFKTHDDTPMLLSVLQQVSREDFLEGRKGYKDSPHLIAGDCPPTLYSETKEKETSVFYSIKDGISDYNIQSHELIPHSYGKEARLLDSSLNLRTNKHVPNLALSKRPIFHDSSAFEAITFKLKGNELFKCHKQCSRRGEAPNVGFNIEVPSYVCNSASEFCHRDNVGLGRSHLVKMKKKHEKVTPNYGMSQDVVESAKGDLPLNVVVGPSSDLCSMALYETDHNFSEGNEDLSGSDTHGQHIAGQLGTSTLHLKTTQKTRLLTDIIKSEVSGVPNKIYIFNKDAEINSIHTAVNHSKAQLDASKDLDLRSGLKSSLVVHKDGKKHIMSKAFGRTLRAEDNGRSLMSWLKDTVGKVKINKKYGKGKPVTPAAFHSKSALDVSTGIILHPCQSDVGTRRSSMKVMASKKQNKMTRVEDEQLPLTHWKKSTSRKKSNAGNAKYIGADSVQSKSAEDALPGSCGHEGPKHRKAVLNKKKNKMPQNKDGTSTLMHWLKDSLATSTCDSVTDLESHQKASTHQKASPKYEQSISKTCEQDSVDDIPMEIVELMAKNQYERHLLNPENTTGNLYNMQETNKHMNLLRRMDEGACSSTPVDISVLRKQAISLKKPESSNNNHHKELFGVKDRVCRTGNASVYPNSFELFDQNHRLGSSCLLFSSMCKIGELECSSHDVASHSSRSRKDLGFISGLSNNTSSSKSHRKGKTKSSLSSTQTRRPSSRRFLAQDGNLRNAKKRFLSPSDSVGQSKNNEMTGSMKNHCMTEICPMNRNPAEFTIPGAGNAYMIGSEDLKYLDMFPSSDRLCVTANMDGHKRRRMMKLSALHGH